MKKYLRISSTGLVIAIVIGLLAAGQLVLASMGSREHWSFKHAVIMQTPFWALWALLFPLILWLVDRLPLERGVIRQNIILHIGAGFGVVMFHYGFVLWFMHAIGHGYPKHHSFIVHFQEAARFRLWVHFVGYMLLLGVALARDYYRKYRERQLVASQLTAQLSQAKLHALRMQLNPHFLFNALNSIAMLTRRNDNKDAVRMLAGLGDLLRQVLEGSPADEVPLREEIRFLTRYLDIEKVRFNDRLRVDIDVAEEVLDAFVPNLVLQPVVENAVQHGVARKTSPGRIVINARRLGERLVVQITDDGPGLNRGPSSRSGVGLANTRSRLEQLYGDQFSCELRAGDAAGAVVTISLPFHTEPVSLGIGVA